MRGRSVVVVYLAAAAAAAAVAVPVTRAFLPPRPAAAFVSSPSSPPPAPVGHPRLAGQPPPPPPTIHLPADPATIAGPPYLKFFGWALLDRRTGQTSGSANRETATNTTESMRKVWIPAEYLRHN